MRALSAVDLLFLCLESRKQPMHVSGLCVFEVPDGAGDDFVYRLVQDIKNAGISPNYPFNQLLHRYFFWKIDEQFDVERHFRHVALPEPCGMTELLAYISREHEHTLNKDKPLWEFHLIDGLMPEQAGSPPRFALWLKMHHSMADGVAAMRLFQQSLSVSPTTAPNPFWSLSPKHRHHLESILPAKKSLWHTLKEQASTLLPVAGELLRGLKANLTPSSPFVSTFDAPKSILNQRITSTRQLSVGSFDKVRFTETARRLGVTTNDLLLAVCSGALRRYLISQNALPDKPLIAFVPISLRRDGSMVGNQLSFLLANLGTHHTQPRERLATIKDSMDDGKRRFSRMNQAQTINYSITTYAWAGVNLALGLAPAYQAFNLIISNVPGDSETLYLNGARLTGIYPASVLFDGQAMNITIANHQDKIDFGITACRSALPDIGGFLGLVEDELAVFENLLISSQK